MTGDTIRDVKKRLAAAFPEVVFTYDKAGNGREAGNRVCWHDDPKIGAVRQAVWVPPGWWMLRTTSGGTYWGLRT